MHRRRREPREPGAGGRVRQTSPMSTAAAVEASRRRVAAKRAAEAGTPPSHPIPVTMDMALTSTGRAAMGGVAPPLGPPARPPAPGAFVDKMTNYKRAVARDPAEPDNSYSQRLRTSPRRYQQQAPRSSGGGGEGGGHSTAAWMSRTTDGAPASVPSSVVDSTFTVGDLGAHSTVRAARPRRVKGSPRKLGHGPTGGKPGSTTGSLVPQPAKAASKARQPKAMHR